METFETPHGPFSCYTNDQNFYFHLSNNGFWESELILNFLRPFYLQANTILDIGAHIGSHSFIYSHYNPQATIYAFEPQKEIYKLLTKNMESRPNVHCLNMCVGHKTGLVTLSSSAKNGNNSDKAIQYGSGDTMNLGGISLGLSGEIVSMITIDSLNLKECDFIKIDVEGAEGLVIQGAKETLRKYKPIICFEYTPSMDTDEICKLFDLPTLPNVQDELRAIGYISFRRIEGDNWLAFPY
jgi:FkbM family methyltransferase